MNKTYVLLLFGGYPEEHESTIFSASNILPCFDPEKYAVHLLYITKEGQWLLCETSRFKTHCDIAEEIIPSINGKPVFLKIGSSRRGELLDATSLENIPVDVVFSLLTNKYGNDGAVQGLWSLAKIPCTGPSILSAAVGLDKDVMKRLLREAGLPICQFRAFSRETFEQASFSTLYREFGLPFFMKPASSGSSLGVHKVSDELEFIQAAEDIWSRDVKLIVEENIEGSELELYCLGVGTEIKTTIIRESIIQGGFYDHYSKYVNDDHVVKNVPAKLPEGVAAMVQEIAVKAYRALEGRNLARMDLFYAKDGRVLVNEINTSPAFMSHANQPPLWEKSGVSYQALVDLMIREAVRNTL